MLPRVYIIIVNYNNWADTLGCLESVQQIDYNNYDVVIVDNNSEQPPNQAEISYPIIYNKVNLGFAGGNNVGINYALNKGTDYVLLLNNDTVVDKNFLKQLVKTAEKDVTYGIVGPKIYYHNEPHKLWFAGGRISPYSIKGTHIGVDQVDIGQFDLNKSVDYITGCCMLIKQEVLDHIGLLDEDYFLYYEDSDYCWKAKGAGYDCLLVTTARIWHKCSSSTIAGSAAYIYYHTRNGLILIRKNGNLIMQVSSFFVSLYIAFKQVIKLIFYPEKRIWAKSVLRGIKDFYLGRTGSL